MPKVPPRIECEGIKEENIPCILEAWKDQYGTYWVNMRGGWRIPGRKVGLSIFADSLDELNEKLSHAEKIPRKKRASSKNRET